MRAQAFEGFEEGKLEFNPTYKYHADGHECVARRVLYAWGSI